MKNLICLLVILSWSIYPQIPSVNTKGQKASVNTSASSTYLLSVNRLKMPLDNSGVLANVSVGGIDIATYDGVSTIFSAGLIMSGYSDTVMWANAVASASRIEDYMPGRVGSSPSDPKNLVYVVSVNDPPFGSSWVEWIDAVQNGADFYDGNNDGVYNPIDLNSNGVWDANEDKPDILGDVTTYTVFNDNRPSSLRRFTDVQPQGIEIRQTLFAYADSSNSTLNNTIFVRYKIINAGTVVQQMDSVYFCFWADPDVGDYVDDLVGCDTLLNAGYVYHKDTDSQFGFAAPTVLTTVLQGPYYYKAGETFIDYNNNGIFDINFDTPLDTAFNKKGSLLGMEVMPGAANRKMTSFAHYMSSHPTQGDANTRFEARNYLKGFNKYGDKIDPCNWSWGSVTNVNCSSVNPIFMYSGNPVENIGWVNLFGTDQRSLVNTGPFTLKQNEPIVVMGAFVVGRKDDPFSSFYEARRITSYIRSFYESNFGQFPLGTDKEDDNQLETFSLSQNYPNPFNPLTTICYNLPQSCHVKLVVLNLLGEEVVTLVDEFQNRGEHFKSFDAKDLSSGMYIYKLSTDNYTHSRKMLLLK
mgnify:CR=1 FL=1